MTNTTGFAEDRITSFFKKKIIPKKNLLCVLEKQPEKNKKKVMSCDKKREFLESLLAFFLECSREFVYLSELVEESLFPAVVHVLRSYKYLIKCDRDEQGLIRIYPHIRVLFISISLIIVKF